MACSLVLLLAFESVGEGRWYVSPAFGFTFQIELCFKRESRFQDEQVHVRTRCLSATRSMTIESNILTLRPSCTWG